MEAAFSAIAQSTVRSQVSYAVAAKAMDAMRQQGGAAIELIKSAAEVQAKAVEGKPRVIDANGWLDVTA